MFWEDGSRLRVHSREASAEHLDKPPPRQLSPRTSQGLVLALEKNEKLPSFPEKIKSKLIL
jgi:hypothetical protein